MKNINLKFITIEQTDYLKGGQTYYWLGDSHESINHQQSHFGVNSRRLVIRRSTDYFYRDTQTGTTGNGRYETNIVINR